MTLAVMTRASLGHTGHTVSASYATQAIYAAVVIAAFTRIAAAIEPAHGLSLLCVATAFWALAFIGFGATYAPILIGSQRR
jgi:uncharacterized protein involved in response to NO